MVVAGQAPVASPHAAPSDPSPRETSSVHLFFSPPRLHPCAWTPPRPLGPLRVICHRGTRPRQRLVCPSRSHRRQSTRADSLLLRNLDGFALDPASANSSTSGSRTRRACCETFEWPFEHPCATLCGTRNLRAVLNPVSLFLASRCPVYVRLQRLMQLHITLLLIST